LNFAKVQGVYNFPASEHPFENMQAGFSAKDLALALPDKEVGDALSLRYIQEAPEDVDEEGAFKPNIDPKKKVFIYRAGQVPDFAEEEEEETWVHKLGNKQDESDYVNDVSEPVRDSRLERLKSRQSERRVHEAAIVDEGDDSDEERERARRRSRAKARRAERDSDDEASNDLSEYVEGDIIPGDQVPC
jgi:hypothetical protein